MVVRELHGSALCRHADDSHLIAATVEQLPAAPGPERLRSAPWSRHRCLGPRIRSQRHVYLHLARLVRREHHEPPVRGRELEAAIAEARLQESHHDMGTDQIQVVGGTVPHIVWVTISARNPNGDSLKWVGPIYERGR